MSVPYRIPVCSLTSRMALGAVAPDPTTPLGRVMARALALPPTEDGGDAFTSGDFVSEQWAAIQRARRGERPDGRALFSVFQTSTAHPDVNKAHPWTNSILAAAAYTLLNFSDDETGDHNVAVIKGVAMLLLLAKEDREQNLKTATAAIASSDILTRSMGLKMLIALGGEEALNTVKQFVSHHPETGYKDLTTEEGIVIAFALGALVILSRGSVEAEALSREALHGFTVLLESQIGFSSDGAIQATEQIVSLMKEQLGEDAAWQAFKTALEKKGLFGPMSVYALQSRGDSRRCYSRLICYIEGVFGVARLSEMTVSLLRSWLTQPKSEPVTSMENNAYWEFACYLLRPRRDQRLGSEDFTATQTGVVAVLSDIFSSPEHVSEFFLSYKTEKPVLENVMNILGRLPETDRAALIAGGRDAVTQAYAALDDGEKEAIQKNAATDSKPSAQARLLQAFGVEL